MNPFALVALLGMLGCSGCITVRCPEPPKSQDGKQLPPQDDKSAVIQTGQHSGGRR